MNASSRSPTERCPGNSRWGCTRLTANHRVRALGRTLLSLRERTPGSALAAEIERRADDRDVGERLREIPELSFRPRVVLLGQEADVVAQREQSLEEPPRVVMAAEEQVDVDEPEAARDERALAGGKAVVGFPAVVAQHQAVHEETLLDLLDCAAHAGIARRQEADHGNQERARVDELRAVRLHERANLRVVALVA